MATDKVTSNPVATYLYYSDNRRAQKTVFATSETTTFFYDGWQVCEETGASNATYVWSPVYVDELVRMDKGGQQFYAHQNARCDVVAITDGAGNVIEKRFYDDFGNVLDEAKNQTVLGATPYGFQGRRLDAETGLYYFRNRYYSSKTGRFIQRDPVWDAGNVGGQYSFAGNGPLSGRDAYGLQGTRERPPNVKAQKEAASRAAQSGARGATSAADDKAAKEIAKRMVNEICSKGKKKLGFKFFLRGVAKFAAKRSTGLAGGLLEASYIAYLSWRVNQAAQGHLGAEECNNALWFSLVEFRQIQHEVVNALLRSGNPEAIEEAYEWADRELNALYQCMNTGARSRTTLAIGVLRDPNTGETVRVWAANSGYSFHEQFRVEARVRGYSRANTKDKDVRTHAELHIIDYAKELGFEVLFVAPYREDCGTSPRSKCRKFCGDQVRDSGGAFVPPQDQRDAGR